MMAEPGSASSPKRGSPGGRTPDLLPPRWPAPGSGRAGRPPRGCSYLGRSAPAPSDGSGKNAPPLAHAHSRSRAFAPPRAPLRPSFGPPRPCPSASARANPVAREDQPRSRGSASQSPNCPRQHPLRCLWGIGCYRVERVRGVHKGLSVCLGG